MANLSHLLSHFGTYTVLRLLIIWYVGNVVKLAEADYHYMLIFCRSILFELVPSWEGISLSLVGLCCCLSAFSRNHH
jgi:hypothetical protein